MPFQKAEEALRSLRPKGIILKCEKRPFLADHYSRGREEDQVFDMIVSKVASIRIVAFAVILAGAAWQPVRAEEAATQHASNGASCARSTFRVLIDVGHTATSPGADSARGVPEYEFNLRLADVIAQSLHEAGFDKTVRLITSGAKLPSLFERTMRANNVHADLFIAVHHDSVPDNLKETWQYERKKCYYSDRFSGYAIFVSNDNADRAGSLAFGHSLGQELQKRGLHYTPLHVCADGAIPPRTSRCGRRRLPVRSAGRAAQYVDAGSIAGSRIDRKPARGT